MCERRVPVGVLADALKYGRRCPSIRHFAGFCGIFFQLARREGNIFSARRKVEMPVLEPRLLSAIAN
jgi:hypothetical protein